MNRGILKLYKTIFVLIIFVCFYGCISKQQIDKQPIVVKHEVNKQIEKKVVVSPKIVVNKKLIKPKIKEKTIVKIEPKIEIKKIIMAKPIIVKEKEVVKQQKTPKVLLSSTQLDKQHLDDFAFDLIKKGKTDDNTLLVVGGIQGDEPGGFMAASLLSTHYDITKGSVWIVPNLNFYSIIKRSRGPFGDMNRKFAHLPKTDPEYKIIQRIKRYITDPKVQLIVNLHDGSGFYRPMHIDKIHNPLKWGQSLVIDQEILSNVEKYQDTYTISKQIVEHMNKFLLKKEDIYRTKNTHTRFKKTHEEQEMAKTLTYYAITNGKSAFGHETSKSLTIPQRVYYKLLALEKFMDIMKIKYTRKFPMTISGIKKVLNEDISIKLGDTSIDMPLKDIRNYQKYFPINSNGVIKYLPSNPLIKIIKQKNTYTIYYGNRRLTRLEADYAEHLNFETKVEFVVDGKKKQVQFGDTITVNDSFKVIDEKQFRVNVIGYKHKSGIETDKTIKKEMFIKRYSMEKNGKIYRVEFYKKKKFAGMILVKFT